MAQSEQPEAKTTEKTSGKEEAAATAKSEPKVETKAKAKEEPKPAPKAEPKEEETGTVEERLKRRLSKMKAAGRKAGIPDFDTRIRHLDRLERIVLDKKDEIAKAISKDFGNRSRHESLIAEVFVTAGAIKHARTHLADWMEPESRDVGWTFLPGRAELRIQPLGVVGIISPWNYPVQLALSPLAGVIAAGNRAMIKPSELVPETSELLKKMIADNFDENFITVITGGIEEGVAFSKLPFDHLVFTGSTSVGKIVMRAAAENLTPVTLELGGKSPAIVSPSYSIATAAKKIMMGKLFNAGQTCIAPDYVLLPKGRTDAFVEECKNAVAEMYPKLGDNVDYTSVVSDKHYARLQGYVKDAEDKGAKVIKIDPAKEDLSPETRKMHPTLVVGAKDEMTVLQDEIFGPVLPIVEYESLDGAIDYVNDRPRPLALYYFDHDDRRIERVLDETISGGVTINETMLHVAQDDLPFGGVGPSGMGHYHAKEGFDSFSKRRAVFYQARINGMSLMAPPYKGTLDKMLKLLLR
jgi:coniferyl-aldehyde dehydrogenase